jgi:2,3-bisphosphoglycerate-dependent phosphoglycerate mutase
VTGQETKLVLVRHGQSQVMVDRVVGGLKGCRGLSDLGRRQAAALRDRLARTGELSADAVYTSTMPRAMETAAIVAPALGHEPAEDEDLCELHPGECDGLAWDDAVAQYAIEYNQLGRRPLSPGGELGAEFQARVAGVVDRLVDRHAGQTVVAFCHGGVVVAASLHLLGLPAYGSTAPVGFTVEVTALTEWRISDERRVFHRFNDHAHLTPDLAPER